MKKAAARTMAVVDRDAITSRLTTESTLIRSEIKELADEQIKLTQASRALRAMDRPLLDYTATIQNHTDGRGNVDCWELDPDDGQQEADLRLLCDFDSNLSEALGGVNPVPGMKVRVRVIVERIQ